MSTVHRRDIGAVALLTIENPPVNALSARVRADLLAAIVAAEADPAVAAVVLTATGRTFVAGADISEFGKPPLPPALPDVFARVEACAKPVVVALNGAALGGGCELALAAHARIAAPAASIGLPEIKLGLLPGAGGTQRLPRLIGAAKAFAVMLSGALLGAEEAVAVGLVDEVAAGDLVAVAVAAASAYAEIGAARRLSAVAAAWRWSRRPTRRTSPPWSTRCAPPSICRSRRDWRSSAPISSRSCAIRARRRRVTSSSPSARRRGFPASARPTGRARSGALR